MKIFKSLCLVMFVCSITFSSNLFAQGNIVVSKKLRAKQAYKIVPKSLDSKIPGIVESTIYNLIEIKKYYPSGDYSDVVEKLNDIAQNYPDKTIRAKAYLAGIYLSSRDLLDVNPVENYSSHDYIFKQIAEQLENKLVYGK